MFLIYEDDIVRNKRETLRRVCRFLDVQTNLEFRGVDALRNPSLQTRLGLVLAQLPLGTGNAGQGRGDRARRGPD
jgi:hypothetical protein